jgi:hypothetical protein
MCRLLRTIGWASLLFAIAASANADTREVKHETPAVVAKMGSHCSDDPNCFNRYHPGISRLPESILAKLSSSKHATHSIAI